MDPILLGLGILAGLGSLFGGISASNEAARQRSKAEEAWQQQIDLLKGVFEQVQNTPGPDADYIRNLVYGIPSPDISGLRNMASQLMGQATTIASRGGIMPDVSGVFARARSDIDTNNIEARLTPKYSALQQRALANLSGAASASGLHGSGLAQAAEGEARTQLAAQLGSELADWEKQRASILANLAGNEAQGILQAAQIANQYNLQSLAPLFQAANMAMDTERLLGDWGLRQAGLGLNAEQMLWGAQDQNLQRFLQAASLLTGALGQQAGERTASAAQTQQQMSGLFSFIPALLKLFV